MVKIRIVARAPGATAPTGQKALTGAKATSNTASPIRKASTVSAGKKETRKRTGDKASAKAKHGTKVADVEKQQQQQQQHKRVMPRPTGKRKPLTHIQIASGCGLNRQAWRALARRNNTAKLYDDVLNAGRAYMTELLKLVLSRTTALAEHDRRKTIMSAHVVRAFQSLGQGVFASE